MTNRRLKIGVTAVIVGCCVAVGGALGGLLGSVSTQAAVLRAGDLPVQDSAATHRAGTKLDRSGHSQMGLASFYANRYAGKTMADGTPMRLYSNNAASITLPLGTTARVVNIENGRSAVVTIRDRGPYVHGRIIDLSPATARLIGIKSAQGLGKVEVTPLSVPLEDGTVWQSHAVIARN